MVGELQCSGIGTPLEGDVCKSAETLWSTRKQSNAALMKELREDTHSVELLRMTKEDASLGRMSTPLPVHDISEVDCLLSPRFAVEQAKPDGSMTLRAVDHFSWAARWEADGGAAARPSKKELKEMSVNGHVLPKEKLKHDTLDELIATMSMFVAIVGSIPALWKADIDAAFRRIAVRPAHRWTCGVAFVVNGLVRGIPPCYAPPQCAHLLGRCVTRCMQLAHLARWPAFTHGKEWVWQ